MDNPSQNSRPYDPGFAEGADVVFGGGLAGLSAAYVLSRAGRRAVVFEADSTVGGLSKTIETGGFRYDIGGHRFFTKIGRVEDMVRELMGAELVPVHRKSKIFMRGRFFDYPLKPANAILGLGMFTVMKIMADYGWRKMRRGLGNGRCVSLEDWVVSNFGRVMFNIYFKEYTEKVWGLDCSRISQDWVEKRISGLSLSKAVKNAFFRFTGKDIPTLADVFLYPELGIGRISERFAEEIEKTGRVHTETAISGLSHEKGRITAVEVRNCRQTYNIAGGSYLSTIPLNTIVQLMKPEPPEEVVHAARSLGFRDLIITAVKVDRESVTDQSWIYIPEKKYPFGRLHEPKCWSEKMAPPGRTLVAVEFFCFRGDEIWNSPDEKLSAMAVSGLEEMGFIKSREVLGVDVLRVPRAYPLFEVGYEKHCKVIYDYLRRFDNLRIAGRAGMFQYQNMDHAIASGMEAAGEIIGHV